MTPRLPVPSHQSIQLLEPSSSITHAVTRRYWIYHMPVTHSISPRNWSIITHTTKTFIPSTSYVIRHVIYFIASCAILDLTSLYNTSSIINNKDWMQGRWCHWFSVVAASISVKLTPCRDHSNSSSAQLIYMEFMGKYNINIRSINWKHIYYLQFEDYLENILSL